MHQVWSNTSSFIKEQEINWIINDFALIWNASGIWSDVSGSIEIISSDFNFGNKKYQLRISERTGRSITVDGVSLDPADKLVFFVNLCKPKEVDLTGGSLSIDVEGQKIAGIFGDPSGKTIAPSVESNLQSGLAMLVVKQTHKIIYHSPFVRNLSLE